MYPAERSLVQKLKNMPFVLLGVNSDKDRDELKDVMDKEKITWRSFWDGGSTKGPIASAWHVQAWPTMFVIDDKGIVQLKIEGANETLLSQALLKLLPRVKKTVVAKRQEKGDDEDKATTSEKTEKTEAPKRTVSKDATTDKDKQSQQAETKLGFAKSLLDDGKVDKAKQRLRELVKNFPKTPAGEEAKELLEKLDK